MAERPRVLYLVYWGAAEPLGQALVLPSVLQMAARGTQLTLVTFDKAVDLAQRERITLIGDSLRARGIRWISLRYHKRPQFAAKLFDFAHGWVRAVFAGLGRTDIVHARTFFGGVIGFLVALILRAKLIFHAEGFYPAEMVDGGAWEPRSLRHLAARWIESQLYRRADAVIVLSERARTELLARLHLERSNTSVAVVPSVVELTKFRAANSPRTGSGMTLVYSGSIGYRYLFERAARFAAVAHKELHGVRLLVLTLADQATIELALASSGLPRENVSVKGVAHSEMPGELAQCDAGLFFLTEGPSNSGFSPTKVGEYWACGLPVVTTRDASDIDTIVRSERVGVVVEGHSDHEYVAAVQALRQLLGDPDLSARCRHAAEKHYALEPACDAQVLLYRHLLTR